MSPRFQGVTSTARNHDSPARRSPVNRLSRRFAPSGGALEGGAPRVAAFHGGKGGVGTTTLAVECAAAACRSGAAVGLMDLDLYGGDTRYRLDCDLTDDGYTFADLLPVIDELDGRMIDNAFSRRSSGVRLLRPPPGPAVADTVEPGHVLAAVEAARSFFDLVMLDTAARSDPAARTAIDCCDLLILVTSPELSSLGRSLRLLDGLEGCASTREKTLLVINRSLGRHDPIAVDEAEGFLGMPACAVVPEAASAFRRAADEGLLLCGERSAAARAVAAAVAAVTADLPRLPGR